jgi:hypothetical protein
MNTSIIESPALMRTQQTNLTQRADRTDYDMQEIAAGFGKQFGSRTTKPDFGTTTLGEVTFRRVDPLRDPFQVADARLQTRLESLCETLRAKY